MKEDSVMQGIGVAEQKNALLISAKELAKLLNVSTRQIWRMRSSGKLPKPLILGCHSIRWRTSEIENWLEADAPDMKTWEVIKGGYKRGRK
jgi:excisionase family DNA binding protein